MRIETKFEIGQTIFAYSKKIEKIVSAPLYRIDIQIEENGITYKYWIKTEGAYEILDNVYETKEDLITAIS